jgi:hypothetical protein
MTKVPFELSPEKFSPRPLIRAVEISTIGAKDYSLWTDSDHITLNNSRRNAQAQFGTSCVTNRGYEQFDPEIVNASLATTVSMLSPDAQGNAVSGDLDLFNWLDLSNIGDIFILIGLCLAGLVVLILLVVVIVNIVKCLCRRRAARLIMQNVRRDIVNETLQEDATTNHDSSN